MSNEYNSDRSLICIGSMSRHISTGNTPFVITVFSVSMIFANAHAMWVK